MEIRLPQEPDLPDFRHSPGLQHILLRIHQGVFRQFGHVEPEAGNHVVGKRLFHDQALPGRHGSQLDAARVNAVHGHNIVFLEFAFSAVLQQEGHIPFVLRVRRNLQQPDPHAVGLRLRQGFPDPADGGQIAVFKPELEGDPDILFPLLPDHRRAADAFQLLQPRGVKPAEAPPHRDGLSRLQNLIYQGIRHPASVEGQLPHLQADLLFAGVFQPPAHMQPELVPGAIDLHFFQLRLQLRPVDSPGNGRALPAVFVGHRRGQAADHILLAVHQAEHRVVLHAGIKSPIGQPPLFRQLHRICRHQTHHVLPGLIVRQHPVRPGFRAGPVIVVEHQGAVSFLREGHTAGKAFRHVVPDPDPGDLRIFRSVLRVHLEEHHLPLQIIVSFGDIEADHGAVLPVVGHLEGHRAHEMPVLQLGVEAVSVPFRPNLSVLPDLRRTGGQQDAVVRQLVRFQILQDHQLGGHRVLRLLLRQLHFKQRVSRRVPARAPGKQVHPPEQDLPGQHAAEGLDILLVSGAEGQRLILLFPSAFVPGLVGIGMVQGKASGPFLVGPGVHHRRRQLLLQAPGVLVFLHPGHQVRRVHQVIPGGNCRGIRLAESRGAHPQPGQSDELLLPHPLLQRREHGIQRGHGLRGRVQVHAGQRQDLPAVLPALEVGIHDPPPGFRSVRVQVQAAQKPVVPSEGRLRLLGGDHVFRPGRQPGGHLQGAHQARVKSDPAQPLPRQGVLQRPGDLSQRQVIHLVGLVPADPLQRPAAVVPEDQGVFFRRIAVHAEADHLLQRLPVPHVQGPLPPLHPPDPSRPDLIDVRRFLAEEARAVPGVGSAGHHQHAHVPEAHSRVHHLPDIRRGGPVAALQVAPAHVDHQGQLSALCPGGSPLRERRQHYQQDHQHHQQRPQPRPAFLFHSATSSAFFFFRLPFRSSHQART